nr:hypothetical protein [uncultured Sphaerochaeta sp.]
MKKTIAILLVLVIGMAGVFAADGAPGSTAEAKINLNTNISAFAAFGLTDFETTLSASDFVSLTAFNLATEDEVSFTTVTDMYDFVGGTPVGYLHGINNNIIDIDLGIAITPFTTSDDANASIPLTLNITEATISATDGTLGTLENEQIIVSATQADIDLAPASENYEATVTITVTTEA